MGVLTILGIGLAAFVALELLLRIIWPNPQNKSVDNYK